MPVVPKELLRPGTYYPRSGAVTFDLPKLHHFCEQGNRMLDSGIDIQVPLEHQDDAKPLTRAEKLARTVLHNAGWVQRYRMDGDSLWVDLDVLDEEVYKRLPTTIKYVSPEIEFNDYRTGDGAVWKDGCITHVALTPVPVWAGQKPFEAPVAMSRVRLSLQDYADDEDSELDALDYEDAAQAVADMESEGTSWAEIGLLLDELDQSAWTVRPDAQTGQWEPVRTANLLDGTAVQFARTRDFKAWEPYQGKRGGRGWRNKLTGRVIYGGKIGLPMVQGWSPERRAAHERGKAERSGHVTNALDNLVQQQGPEQITGMAQRLTRAQLQTLLSDKLGQKVKKTATKKAMLEQFTAYLHEKHGATQSPEKALGLPTIPEGEGQPAGQTPTAPPPGAVEPKELGATVTPPVTVGQKSPAEVAEKVQSLPAGDARMETVEKTPPEVREQAAAKLQKDAALLQPPEKRPEQEVKPSGKLPPLSRDQMRGVATMLTTGSLEQALAKMKRNLPEDLYQAGANLANDLSKRFKNDPEFKKKSGYISRQVTEHLNSLAKAAQPGEPHAVEKGPEQPRREPEREATDAGGTQTEPSGGDQPQEGGQEPKQVEPHPDFPARFVDALKKFAGGAHENQASVPLHHLRKQMGTVLPPEHVATLLKNMERSGVVDLEDSPHVRPDKDTIADGRAFVDPDTGKYITSLRFNSNREEGKNFLGYAGALAGAQPKESGATPGKLPVSERETETPSSGTAYPQTTDRTERDTLAKRNQVHDVPRADVDALVAAVKKHGGDGNQASLVDIRKELGWERQRADRAISRARIEQAVGLAAFEGRVRPSPEKMEEIKKAAIHEDDPHNHLIWASVRQGWDKTTGAKPLANKPEPPKPDKVEPVKPSEPKKRPSLADWTPPVDSKVAKKTWKTTSVGGNKLHHHASGKFYVAEHKKGVTAYDTATNRPLKNFADAESARKHVESLAASAPSLTAAEQERQDVKQQAILRRAAKGEKITAAEKESVPEFDTRLEKMRKLESGVSEPTRTAPREKTVHRRAALSVPTKTSPLRLSRGGTMPPEKPNELSADGKTKEAVPDQETGVDAAPAPEPEPDAGKFVDPELIELLQKHGVHMDGETKCGKEFENHLKVALRALSGVLAPAEEDETPGETTPGNPGTGEAPAMTEEKPGAVAMSLADAEKKIVQLSQTNDYFKQELAQAKLTPLLARIDTAVKVGVVTKERADAWKKTLGEDVHRLSLASPELTQDTRVIQELLAFAEEQVQIQQQNGLLTEQTGVRMSLTEVAPPNWGSDGNGVSPERIKAIKEEFHKNVGLAN